MTLTSNWRIIFAICAVLIVALVFGFLWIFYIEKTPEKKKTIPEDLTKDGQDLPTVPYSEA